MTHPSGFQRFTLSSSGLHLSTYSTLALRPSYHIRNYSDSTRFGGRTLRPAVAEEPLSYLDSIKLSDPRTLVKHLNNYVIGQERAKKILAVAIFNHYNRVRANIIRQQQQQHQLQQRRQQEAGQAENDERPYAEHHHPTLPQEYYVTGSPIQSVGADLVPAERISSYSKWSQRRPWINPPSEAANSSRSPDESESKSLPFETEDEGQDTTVYDKSNVLLIGPTGSGKTLLARTLAQVLQVPFSMSDATPFTQAGYVGEDVELVIQRLLQACDYDVKKAETGIVFIDEIDKISRRSDSHSASKDVSGEGVQQSLLRMLEGTVVNVTDKSGAGSSQNKRGPSASSFGGGQAGGKSETYSVDTSNILFILSGAFIGIEKTVQNRLARGSIGFDAMLRSPSEDVIETKGVHGGKRTAQPLDLVEPADLVKYGLIPEFVGRLPVLASVNQLSVDDLVRVLTEPKNSLLKQYQGLFDLNKVGLRFSRSALKCIAEQALEKKTGARGLRRIMVSRSLERKVHVVSNLKKENILLDPMYDAPGSYIAQIVIDSKVVNKEKSPIYLGDDQKHLAEKIIAEDDDTEVHSEVLQMSQV
ncbi:hypothetical protein DFQ28_000998 [Apophysomyces sp. BC1034]|nr:hypothetical protein DFQ28_000998 [Apophysomyces sp. BC1034]